MKAFEESQRDFVRVWMKNGSPVAEQFPPVPVFSLEQVGYPTPTEGKMIERFYGGTDLGGRLLPPNNAPWCKVADVVELLQRNGIDFYTLRPVEKE